MSLSAVEAIRLVRFCLGVHDSADATLRPDGTCAVTITLWRTACEIRTFDGASFEEALRRAAAADVLKGACVDRQIAFLAQAEPRPAAAAAGSAAPEPAPSLLPDGAANTGARFLALTEAVGALLHETQRERGLSTLFAGSRGRLLAGELGRQWRRTDARRSALRAFLDEQVVPGAVRRRCERADKLLATLGSLRAGVKGREVEAPQAIEAYTAVNVELLASIDAFMVAGAMGGALSHALACVALLYAKEKTGVERAQLANVFLEDRFTDQQRQSVAGLLSAQSSYFHIFSAAAPRAADQLLRRALASPAATEVQRLEGVAFGSDSDQGLGIDPVVWFDAISRKIEMLAGVSRTVISMLREEG